MITDGRFCLYRKLDQWRRVQCPGLGDVATHEVAITITMTLPIAMQNFSKERPQRAVVSGMCVHDSSQPPFDLLTPPELF